jgi:hypothetical protein
MIWAAGVFLVGVLTIAIVLLSAPEDLKFLLGIGGAFVSTLSSFPIKDLSRDRDKLAALTFLRRGFEHLPSLEEPERAPQLEKLETSLWELVHKSLGA